MLPPNSRDISKKSDRYRSTVFLLSGTTIAGTIHSWCLAVEQSAVPSARPSWQQSLGVDDWKPRPIRPVHRFLVVSVAPAHEHAGRLSTLSRDRRFQSMRCPLPADHATERLPQLIAERHDRLPPERLELAVGSAVPRLGRRARLAPQGLLRPTVPTVPTGFAGRRLEVRVGSLPSAFIAPSPSAPHRPAGMIWRSSCGLPAQRS